VNVPKDLRFLRYLLLKLFTARPVPKGKQDKPRRDWSCYRSSSANGSGLIELAVAGRALVSSSVCEAVFVDDS